MSNKRELYRVEYSKLAEAQGCYPLHFSPASISIPRTDEWLASWETMFVGENDKAIAELEKLTDEYNKRCDSRAARSGGGLAIRFRIFKRDGYRCKVCGRDSKDGVKLELGHIVAKANGGTYEESNLVTLCFDCNRGQSTDTL